MNSWSNTQALGIDRAMPLRHALAFGALCVLAAVLLLAWGPTWAAAGVVGAAVLAGGFDAAHRVEPAQ